MLTHSITTRSTGIARCPVCANIERIYLIWIISHVFGKPGEIDLGLRMVAIITSRAHFCLQQELSGRYLPNSHIIHAMKIHETLMEEILI